MNVKHTGPRRQSSLFVEDAEVAAESAGGDAVTPSDAPAPSRAAREDLGTIKPDPSPPASPARPLYLTADLRVATGLTRTAMDFYLRAGVVRPVARTESGYLLFDADELALLHRVLAWRARGISLRDIRTYLGRETADDAGQTPDTARNARDTKAALQ